MQKVRHTVGFRLHLRWWWWGSEGGAGASEFDLMIYRLYGSVICGPVGDDDARQRRWRPSGSSDGWNLRPCDEEHPARV